MRITPLTSNANPLLKKIRSLHERAARHKAGLFLLEGEKMFLEAVSRGIEIDSLLMEDSFYEKGLSQNIERAFEASADLLPDELHVVWSGFFKQLATTATSCGMVAAGWQIEATLDDILADFEERRAADRPSTIVILEGVQDPGNLGAIIRSALAFEASGVILTRGTVDLYNPKVVRAAMGALFDIPVIQDANLSDVLAKLKQKGFAVCSLNPEAEQSLTAVPLPKNLALLLGNEGAGLTAEATALADFDLNIQISAQIESLNVSIAAAIVLFHLADAQAAKRV